MNATKSIDNPGAGSFRRFNVGKKKENIRHQYIQQVLLSSLIYYVYESLSNCSVLVSLGHLVMDLNHMLRPAKSPEKCTLQVLDQPLEKLVSLFEQKTVKGWWPCTCENNGEKIIAVRAQTHTHNHFQQGAKTYKSAALFVFCIFVTLSTLQAHETNFNDRSK